MELPIGDDSIRKHDEKQFTINLYKLCEKKEYKKTLLKDIKTIKILDKVCYQDENDPKNASKKMYTVECDVLAKVAEAYKNKKFKLYHSKTQKHFQNCKDEEEAIIKDGRHLGYRKKCYNDYPAYTAYLEKLAEERSKASYYEDATLGWLNNNVTSWKKPEDVWRYGKPWNPPPDLVYKVIKTGCKQEPWENLIFTTKKTYFQTTHVDKDALIRFCSISPAAGPEFIDTITTKITKVDKEKARKIATEIFERSSLHKTLTGYLKPVNNEDDMITNFRNCRKQIKSLEWDDEWDFFTVIHGLMAVFIFYCKGDSQNFNKKMNPDKFWKNIVGMENIEPMIEDPRELKDTDWEIAVEKLEPTTLEGLGKGKGKVLAKLKKKLKKIKGWKGRGFLRSGPIQPPKMKKFQELKF